MSFFSLCKFCPTQLLLCREKKNSLSAIIQQVLAWSTLYGRRKLLSTWLVSGLFISTSSPVRFLCMYVCRYVYIWIQLFRSFIHSLLPSRGHYYLCGPIYVLYLFPRVDRRSSFSLRTLRPACFQSLELCSRMFSFGDYVSSVQFSGIYFFSAASSTYISTWKANFIYVQCILRGQARRYNCLILGDLGGYNIGGFYWR